MDPPPHTHTPIYKIGGGTFWTKPAPHYQIYINWEKIADVPDFASSL